MNKSKVMGVASLGLALIAGSIFAYRRTRAVSVKGAALKSRDGDSRWDITDQTSWESFPASDPPATY